MEQTPSIVVCNRAEFGITWTFVFSETGWGQPRVSLRVCLIPAISFDSRSSPFRLEIFMTFPRLGSQNLANTSVKDQAVFKLADSIVYFVV